MASSLPLLESNPTFIFFTDFDGTITIEDSNDYLTDNIGFGEARRRELNMAVLDGSMSFRDSFDEMVKSIHKPYPECIEYLKQHVKLDPYFKEFFFWATANNIPVVVVSSGMVPIIEALLRELVGPEAEKMTIIANSVKIHEDQTWNLVFRDESHFGHDKSRCIRPYAQLPAAERPTLFYAGDGVSDLSAAKETDLLFAKTGRDLVTYCVKEEIPFTLFDDWETIWNKTKAIVSGKISVQDAAKQGYEDFKRDRANTKSDPTDTTK